MARIEDLLSDISDAKLRKALEEEVKRLKDATEFGLVFERHEPESVLLPSSVGLQEGSQVRLRKEPTSKTRYVIKSLSTTKATLEEEDGTETKVPVKDLLLVKAFDEPIFPTLIDLDGVERGGDRPPHLVIEADNYHALEQLSIAYEGQIDCIYIDPPYNTGARDWKYNNDYVDGNDKWRHSRWLSFMEKRLRLAKRLLKPNGVLVVTIDEHEVANLSLLLAESGLFASARRQMVTIVTNAAGVSQGGFSRVEEYAIFCFLGDAQPCRVSDDLLSDEGKASSNPVWESIMRSGGVAAEPSARPGLVYPIGIDPKTNRVVGVGPTLRDRVDSGEVSGNLDDWKPAADEKVGSCPVIWPIRGDGSLGRWRIGPTTLVDLGKEGFVRARKSDKSSGGNEFAVSYVKSGNRAKILSGEIANEGRDPNDGSYIVGPVTRSIIPKTVWRRSRHNAGNWGSRAIRELLGSVSFSYAKSPYAVLDTLRTLVGQNPEAVVLDFFAGSGTTLQATAMLNAEDGGRRRCILVTNNEVEDATARRLIGEGNYPGDPTYESEGIFHHVTKPRCQAAVEGVGPDGKELQGEYLGGRKLSQGFEENIQFVSIGYLSAAAVELGLEWDKLSPMMWLVSGARGSCPTELDLSAGFAIASASGYAVLADDESFPDLIEAVRETEGIQQIFLLTDSEDAYAEMTSQLPGRKTHMWPRDYLRFFRQIAEARS
jgi:adenine-specific DNA-methyltransferase